jgi:hypothetical protein
VATQLLIYENAVPVSLTSHRNWSVEATGDYRFSRNVNAVPLMAVEFQNAAAEYPVVFGGTGDVVMPAVILGLRADENLHVDEEGRWQGKYIPAFVRRYPFVFSSNDDGKTFTLCIDEKYAGCNQEGRGEALFDADGKRTTYVENVLKFLQQYQLEFQRTQAFCTKLKTLNLLEPMHAQIEMGSGERLQLTGFSAVNRSRLKTLPSQALADLMKSDELELIYTHMYSMRNFAAMRERIGSLSAAPDSAGGSGRGADPASTPEASSAVAEAPTRH